MQLAADELDVDLAKINVVEGDTWLTVDQGYTAGSQSNKTEYAATGALRQAAAEARLALLNMAAPRLPPPGPQPTGGDGGGSVQGDSSRAGQYRGSVGGPEFAPK